MPQFTVRDAPQLSAAVREPQFAPRRVQKAVAVSGTQAATHCPLVLQVRPLGHVPQVTRRVVPQLSAAERVPQVTRSRLQKVALDSATQVATHCPLLLQVRPDGHGPQEPPQPSLPQLLPPQLGVHAVTHV